MKKICFIVSNSFFANAFLNEPIKILSKHYSVHLICNTENKDNIEIENPNIKKIFSIRIYRTIAPFRDLVSFIQICQIIRKEKFDVIHTLTPKAGLLGIIAAYLMKVPNRFHTFTGQVWISKKGVLKYLLIALDKIVIKLSSKIIVDGNSQKEFLINENLLKEENATVFYNVSTCGINLKKFKPDSEIRKQKRLKYNIPYAAKVFLYLGRLNIDKGIEELIEAYLLLNNKNSFLFLVGPMEMDITKEMLKKYNLNNIIYIPYTNKPQDILQLCDVFCFPSHREGFGYSVIEASALEKPIICSDIYGLKYTCIHQKTGLKHKAKSTMSLLEKMEFAIAEPKKMRQMGEMGRTYVGENFSEEKVLKKWEQFYAKFV
jgi:glycosyltransferase involved in cell wall biosynthesis